MTANEPITSEEASETGFKYTDPADLRVPETPEQRLNNLEDRVSDSQERIARIEAHLGSTS